MHILEMVRSSGGSVGNRAVALLKQAVISGFQEAWSLKEMKQ
jgi:hypothetical protein